MTDLSTTYLGLRLRSPLVPAASPLADEIDDIRRMEEAGAGAIVLRSLFEEQLNMERHELNHHLHFATDSHPEAQTYVPEPDVFRLGPDEYLDHIQMAKRAVRIPIIASLNGATRGGWVQYAERMEECGADAIELNIYRIPSDFQLPGAAIEQETIDIVQAIRETVTVPLAIKLSPFYSNLGNMAMRLEHAGANGLVLFNRFYQPDIDLEHLEIKPRVLLSTPQALRLPLTWIGILYGRVGMDLAATSGIHTAHDVIKMIMVGANITMLMSVLMKRGIGYIRELEFDVRQWLDEHEYDSIAQMRGSMSQKRCHNPAAFERAQYMRALQNFQP